MILLHAFSQRCAAFISSSFVSAQFCLCLIFFCICTALCCYCNRRTAKRKNWDSYYSFYNRRYTQQYINHKLKHFHMMKNYGYSKLDSCHHEIFDKMLQNKDLAHDWVCQKDGSNFLFSDSRCDDICVNNFSSDDQMKTESSTVYSESTVPESITSSCFTPIDQLPPPHPIE